MDYIRRFAPFLRPNEVFTKSELLDDIRGSFEGLGHALEALLGLRGTSDDHWASKMEPLSVHMCALGELIYDYAVGGVWPDPSRIGDEGIDELFLDFSLLNGWAREAGEHYGVGVPVWSEKILAMAALRARLDRNTINQVLDVVIFDDGVDSFTLFEIAVLAQMHEKSVRNATQPRAKDRLTVTKAGARSLVEPIEALRWLTNRRSFKPTVPPAPCSHC